MRKVECPYCLKLADLVTGERIYPHRADLHSLQFYLCSDCNAYVGCHKRSNGAPLGRLANAELRAAKNKAHFFLTVSGSCDTNPVRQHISGYPKSWVYRLRIVISACSISRSATGLLRYAATTFRTSNVENNQTRRAVNNLFTAFLVIG